MANTVLCCAVVLGSAILAGVPAPACAATNSGAVPWPCPQTNKKCEVKIKVTVRNNACELEIDHDPLIIESGFRKVHIHWRLPSGYQISETDGIVLKYQGDEDGQFYERYPVDDQDQPVPKPSNGGPRIGHHYHWRDKNTSASGGQQKKYQYVINVIDPNNPGLKCQLDPFIVNR